MTDLLVDCDAGVATVTLNRPDRLNALTQPMIVGLWETFTELDAADDVRAIVVTGAGRAFSSGSDLSAGGDGQAFRKDPVVYRHRAWELRTPVIGAINGAAVGVALTMASQWDIRYVAEDAKLAFPFTRRGVSGEAHSAWILPRLVGLSRALELMISGRFFSGAEAAAIGFAARALPRDEVLPAARELALDIATNTSPAMVAANKRLLWTCAQETDAHRGGEIEQRVYDWVRTLDEPAEGAKSFLERRPPCWPTPKSVALPAVINPAD
ncbi:enoyl-CoA hydratase-related protein [Amycolatopsis acidicola]|uniref:enoyl-CoA hydratase-related protein n=1 Tax=Amycolatopsis acidicola TaxID=2596893 RepID=UPI001AA0A8FF|nr:enoyl-CoA hydratase-related protein [Amycolatopsis acidicola]